MKIQMSELDATISTKELEELESAARNDPFFDEDSPEMTAEKLQQFKRTNSKERNKQTVSLRLSPDTLKIAKAYGKGYTSFLSRLLDVAITDEHLVKKCM